MKPLSNEIELDRFLPYRLSVLANRVSSLIAREYHERFGVTIPEWRIIAMLGGTPELTATELASRTAMDKVTVSRAVQSLVDREHVTRTASQSDGRRSHLSLTASGSRIYHEIAPLALHYERAITSDLPPAEIQRLHEIMNSLLAGVERVESEGLD